MIAETCSAYGWRVDYVLKMPASQFFLMLRESRRLHNWRMSEYCDIAAIPLCEPKYHTKLKGLFINRVRFLTPQAATIPEGPVLDNLEAKRMFIHLFRLKKGTVK